MTDDTIYRQAAIDALIKWYGCEPSDIGAFENIIEKLPSAQPKIIRCKDCKHSFLHDNGEKISRICGRTKMCGTTKDDWFCADGERRTV